MPIGEYPRTRGTMNALSPLPPRMRRRDQDIETTSFVPNKQISSDRCLVYAFVQQSSEAAAAHPTFSGCLYLSTNARVHVCEMILPLLRKTDATVVIATSPALTRNQGVFPARNDDVFNKTFARDRPVPLAQNTFRHVHAETTDNTAPRVQDCCVGSADYTAAP